MVMHIEDALPQVAVRELCAFAAKAGDLDLRFTPAPTAREGLAGHQLVVGRRAPGYRAELPLSGTYQNRLRVRGRADGHDPQRHCLEEIKTHKGDLALQPANHRALHWAQAKVYGWLLCQTEGLAELEVALVYLDIGSQQETRFSERCSAAALQAEFDRLCARYIGWAEAEAAHRARRDEGLRHLPFVHGQMRAGQRTLAEHSYHAARRGRCLLAQAPTGIGKTLGTLYPMLKAMPPAAAATATPAAPSAQAASPTPQVQPTSQVQPTPQAQPTLQPQPAPGLDKLYCLSAKGSGRQMAVQALAGLRQHSPALPLRVLELVARDTACVHPDRACHGESCPLAQGFYDKLPGARQAAVDQARHHAQVLDQDSVRTTALAHALCPYYLAQELVRWADVVVGDVNYQFDGSALLHALQQANGWRVGLLVDEAHNLVDRARAMYSAQLPQGDVRALCTAAPAPLRPAFKRLQRAWQAHNKALAESGGALADAQPDARPDAQAGAYSVLPALPERWFSALQELVLAIGEHLAEQQAPGRSTDAAGQRLAPDPALMAFYFDALQFSRLAETFGPHSMLDSTARTGLRGRIDSTLAIRNLVPAPFLAPRFEAAHCSVLFSATLNPPQFYSDTLGLPADTAWLDVPGPFRAEQLDVRVLAHIPLRYSARSRSLVPLADTLAAQFAQRPGNYLAFFSSFDHLAQVQATLAQRHPGLPHWVQTRKMDDTARQAFVGRFTEHSQGIGFAVLGGLFGEGIDLPGKRLIGAFIATLGLPQINPVNEQMRQRMQDAFGNGYAYTYLYPGLRKVVQAAGRVIRTPEDEGTVLLIDERFNQPEVRALLPGWWRVQRQTPAEPDPV